MKIPAHNTIDAVKAPRLARRVKHFKKRKEDRPSPLEPFRTEGYYTIYGDIDDRQVIDCLRAEMGKKYIQDNMTSLKIHGLLAN